MRIACIHLPQYELQCATRVDPSLRGAPLAVASRPGDAGEGRSALHAPIIVACSRAAWALGVRPGMTAVTARGLALEDRPLEIVAADPALERETMRAAAEAILGLAGAVEIAGRIGTGDPHVALYAEVPAKTRGVTFGERVAEQLDALGLTARIGIADDRFTAWVAATHAGACIDRRDEERARGILAVPRGGSAAFLAPRPLSLLAISAEVRHMLEMLGVRTLGEFAALPAPSVSRPYEADYQALARGDSGARLRPYAPEAAICEDIAVNAGNLLDVPMVLARRLALRLAGRDRGAVRLEITAGDRQVSVELDQPAAAEHDLMPVLAAQLAAQPTPRRLRAVISGEAVLGSTERVESPFVAAAPRDLTEYAEPLAVVLSTSGSLFALSSPDLRAERRDAHRRTRRSRPRRERPTTLVGQSRLFERG